MPRRFNLPLSAFPMPEVQAPTDESIDRALRNQSTQFPAYQGGLILAMYQGDYYISNVPQRVGLPAAGRYQDNSWRPGTQY